MEISETVLEELLQNALVHIDLLKTAAIRLLVFDDRIEIVNPGCVVGGHTIEEVKKGNSFARNPLMAKFCAQTMPYRGLGSGIPRVLAEKSKVDFLDDKEGNQFTAIVSRPDTVTNSVSSQDSVEDTTQKTVEKNTLKSTLKSTLKGTRKRIVEMIESNPNTSLDQIAEQLGKNPRGIDKHIKVLREQGIIRRVGPDKGGHWEII